MIFLKKFKYTIIFIALGLLIYLLDRIFHIELFNLMVKLLEKYDNSELSQIFIIFFLIGIGIIFDLVMKLKVSYGEKKESRKLNRAQNFFIAHMSHEFRTPLTSILGFTKILMEKETEPEKRKIIGYIIKSSETLLSLITNIINLSKIENNNLEIYSQKINLKEVLSPTIESAHQFAMNKNLIFSYHLSPQLPDFIYLDPLRIKQIVGNLLTNAIKYTDVGEVNLLIEKKEGALTPSMIITVTDTGIGIAMERQELIFNKFNQHSSSYVKPRPGLGIGLTITKALIEKMQGAIHIDSSLGVGSTFTVTLPLVKEESPRPTPVMVQTQTEQIETIPFKEPTPQKILIAEDNEPLQNFIKIICQNASIPIDIAGDGLEAVELFERNRYAAVFLDIQMPRMNGFDAAKKIKEIEAAIPIVFMSAFVLDEEKEALHNSLADGFLSKPFKTDHLINELLKYLNRSQAD